MATRYLRNFDVKGSGNYVNEEAGATLPIHNLVYRTAAGTWGLADADLAATMPVIGITMGAISSGKKGEILTEGNIGDNTWAWTPGDSIYASTTPGQLTAVAPIAPDLIQVIAVAISATMIYFNSDLGSGGAGTGTIVVRRNSGANVGTQPRLNFIEGTDIGLTIADDPGNTEIDITINNTGPALHAASHEDVGADEMSVLDLSGELADAQKTTVRKNSGANVGTRPRLNLIEGANVTLTIADDGANQEVDITIAAAGGGGAGVTSQWFPASDPNNFKGNHPSMIMIDDEEVTVRQSFIVPQSVTTITEAYVIVIPNGTGNLDWEVETDFGQLAAGEQFDANSDTASGTTAVTNGEIEGLDVSAALTGATAEDLIGIEFKRITAADTVGADVHFIGIWIKGT